MLHASLMPFGRAKRESLRALPGLAVAILCCACAWPGAGHAQSQPRVASINTCTDQLVLALADPEQIVGLSPYSRDPHRSWAAQAASRFPRLSGEAEDVLILKPDVVVAGRFTKRATRELLKEKGLRVAEFDAARSLDDAKQQMLRMGELLGHPDRAAAENARLDAAIARTRAAASRVSYRVLALSRRGWVSGDDSLMSSLLTATGLTSAAGKFGRRVGGFVTLEQIVANRPDLLLVSSDSEFAEDQGRAFLLHPAIEALYPPDKRLVLPEQLTVCGGPMLPEALDRLTGEINRVNR
jgi:iron complex transport system substrate-binding protein